MKVGYNTAGWTKEEYATRLQGLTDEELFKEAKEYIWFSAWANNNPRSAYHWMCDMTHDEARNRGKVKEIYTKAYRSVYKAEFGVDPYSDEEEA